MNIYTLGLNNEYTIHMVKHSCEEFETLTDAQALKICELLAKLKKEEEDSDSLCELQERIDDLEDEVDSLESRNYFLRQQNKDLEQEIKELKNATNK